MHSYLFRNTKKINQDSLIKKISELYRLEIIDNDEKNVVMGNSDLLFDISKKYISILLFNEDINIKKIKRYIMEK